MIEATLEFQSESLRTVLTAFSTLPEALRPTHHSLGEDEPGEPILDIGTLAEEKWGTFLRGSGVLYDISRAGSKSIICNCFLEVEPLLAKQFLMHMETAQPIFGFACTREEQEHRNRVVVKQGINTIESWVGRDTQKYIPGFYWLTLLSEALAEKHGVPFSVVEKVAQEHIEFGDGQHLFRFYERPEDWQTTSTVAELCASLPGVFDVEKIKPQLPMAKNFLDLNAMLMAWK